MLERIDGHKVVRLVGQGGFGAVYLAHDRNTNEPIALKTLLPERTGLSQAEELFRRECSILEQLNHPGAVQIHTTGLDQDYGLYFTMPFLEGGTLENARREHSSSIGKLLNWWIDLVHIIAHAHNRGLVHRDLKPQNILLDNDQIVVVDWGLGRIGGCRSHVTGPGGTQDWSPTELTEGEAGSFTDTFGLIGILGWILTGLPPWDLLGCEATSLEQAGFANQTLAECIQRGLSRHTDRFQSVRDLADQLSGPLVAVKAQLVEQALYDGTDATEVLWPRLMQTTTNSLQPKYINIEFYRSYPQGCCNLTYLNLSSDQQRVIDRYLQLGVRLVEEQGIPDLDRHLWRIQTPNGSLREQQWIFGQRGTDAYRVVRQLDALPQPDQRIVCDFFLLIEPKALQLP